MIPATIIAIEGPDRVGKATQTDLLVKNLRSNGHKVLHVEVPIKSFVTYPLIYWMLRNGLAKKMPNLFQFVQFLNKFMFQTLKLLFCRWVYDFIVFDRWSLSAIVYGDASGANAKFNRFLYKFLWKPDGIVVMVGQARNATTRDVYESDNTLQTQVRNGYAKWYHDHSDDVVIVDNMGTRDEVHSRIMKVLDERFDLL
jgi:dTMP kinase